MGDARYELLRDYSEGLVSRHQVIEKLNLSDFSELEALLERYKLPLFEPSEAYQEQTLSRMFALLDEQESD